MGPVGGSSWRQPRSPREAFSRPQENRCCGSRWWAEAAGCASWIGRIRRTGAADRWARRSSTTVPTDGGSELQDYPRALARGARQLHGPCAKWRRTLRGAEHPPVHTAPPGPADPDRKSTRLNSSHSSISYAVFCLKTKKQRLNTTEHHPKQ